MDLQQNEQGEEGQEAFCIGMCQYERGDDGAQ